MGNSDTIVKKPEGPIKHIVVLMLENRSFDHMLGFLPLNDLNGLKGNESNKDKQNNVISVSSSAEFVVKPDPNHEFKDVNEQLFDVYSDSVDSNGVHPENRNSGFVKNYQRIIENESQDISQVMKCFSRQYLPALTALAAHYTLCDNWFSSVPSSTWPNRFYVHAATSHGHLCTPGALQGVEDIAKDLFSSSYQMRTIYENLQDSNYSWSVFYSDFSLCFLFKSLWDYKEHFSPLKDFFDQVECGCLPSYSFLEPRHFGFFPNNQHASHDVRFGENLIAKVYNVIRSNKEIWEKTLLVILYDEHGGFYDHVFPPTAISPDDISSKEKFMFNRLGVRVPAVLISPWVPQQVDHTLYDHTSLLATVKTQFNLPKFLTRRDQNANLFTNNILSSPREDTLGTISIPFPSNSFSPTPSVSLSSHEKSCLASAEYLFINCLKEKQKTFEESDEGNALNFLMSVGKISEDISDKILKAERFLHKTVQRFLAIL